jgi:hypothetical protein
MLRHRLLRPAVSLHSSSGRKIMKKLRLELEALEVDSFETSQLGYGGGTVHGEQDKVSAGPVTQCGGVQTCGEGCGGGGGGGGGQVPAGGATQCGGIQTCGAGCGGGGGGGGGQVSAGPVTQCGGVQTCGDGCQK